MKKHISKLAALMLLGCSASYAALVSVPGGSITTDTTWTSTNEYILEGLVYVKNATLTIQPGTIIRSQPRTADGIYDPGTLVITRSGKISAVGTATNPIIFTTAALNSGANNVPLDTNADGYFDRAVVSGGALASGTFLDATPKTSPLPATSAVSYGNAQITGGSTTLLAALGGGIIILGEAPTNVDGKVGDGLGGFIEGRGYIEGLPEIADTSYGGDYPLHNSGKLSYISIRHGGAKLSSDNEINGLTLGGVGAGTQIDHIDVYVNFDDGIEVFGGTVNLKYLNINFCEDDGFDVDQGWTGAAQFIFVLQHPLYGDSLAELDGGDQDSKNNGTGSDYLTANSKPFQNCVIANGTWVGRGTTAGKEGLRARAGFGGELLNNVVIQANNGLRIDAETALETDGWDARSRAILGELKFRSNTLYGNTANTLSITQASPNVVVGTFNTATSGWNNSTNNPNFKATAFSNVSTYVNPVGPQTGLPGTTWGSVAALPNNPFFTVTGNRGAFSTDKTANLWTNGWTTLNVSGVLVSKGNL